MSSNFLKTFGTEITQFSDSLIISIKENQNGGINYMITDCSLAIHSLLSRGFLCKGVIHKGKLIHQDNICFGPAYLEAMLMEETEAKPIIKIKKELVEHARKYPGLAQINFENEEIKYILEHVKELNETEYYINFFEDYDVLVGGGWQVTKDHYEKACKFIEDELQKCSSYSVYKKYNWVKNKLNESKIVKAHNIEPINFKVPVIRYVKMFICSACEQMYSWFKKRYLRRKLSIR